METIDSIIAKREISEKTQDPQQMYEAFEMAQELKDHLEIEHDLCPLEFNRIVGFTSEYKLKMGERICAGIF